MRKRGIWRRWVLALAAGLALEATSAGSLVWLLPEPVVAVPAARSREARKAAVPTAHKGGAKSRLAWLWENVALNPEPAIALACLGAEYAEDGETELALQSFQLALDQLSTDRDLDDAGRVRFPWTWWSHCDTNELRSRDEHFWPERSWKCDNLGREER